MNAPVPASLPTPGLADWVRILQLQGRLPTSARRRAKWKAMWQFDSIVARLSPADVAIDCGASGGAYTAQLAANGATVFAFEPDPHGFAGLVPMFATRANVQLINQAVGVEAKPIAFHRTGEFADDPDYHVQSASVFSSKSNTNPITMMVDQIDLPAFIDGLGRRVAVLKMDIEGAEVPILERLLDTGLIDRMDYVFAETHERMIPELVDRTAALRKRVTSEGRRNISLDWV
jgi:FkbM family methyltransferase